MVMGRPETVVTRVEVITLVITCGGLETVAVRPG